jgi:hypothetical protein
MKVTTIRNLIFMTIILAVSVAFAPTEASASSCDFTKECCQDLQEACKRDGGSTAADLCEGDVSVVICNNLLFAESEKFKDTCLDCGGTHVAILGLAACVDL